MSSQKAVCLLKRCITKPNGSVLFNKSHSTRINNVFYNYHLREWSSIRPTQHPRYTRNQIHVCSPQITSTKTASTKADSTKDATTESTASPTTPTPTPTPPSTPPQEDASRPKQADSEEKAGKESKNQREKNFIQKVMVANKKFCADHGFDDFNDGLTELGFLDKQTPLSTVLSCCDSRAPTSALGTEAPNEIFSVRNIGNQFCNSIGSFRYGLEVLKTPYAIIMGHTNCGAIRGAASDYRFLHTMVQQEVISLVRVIRFADSLTNSSKLDEMPFDHRCNVYAEINVDYQINRLLDDFQINERVLAGKLTLIGMMFDVHNVYNKGYGRLHVVNINGDRDILSLKQHPLLTQIKEELGDAVNDQINITEMEDTSSIGDNEESIDIATRLFSYSSSAMQAHRFSHL